MDALNAADFEDQAREVLEPGAYGYFAGGAGDERTLRDNIEAYARRRLRPRVLVDVSGASAATSVLGAEVTMPLLVAPVAFQRVAHPDGESATARAAAAAGTVMCLSTLATASAQEVADAAPGGARWFQLYCFSDRAVTEDLAPRRWRAATGLSSRPWTRRCSAAASATCAPASRSPSTWRSRASRGRSAAAARRRSRRCSPCSTSRSPGAT